MTLYEELLWGCLRDLPVQVTFPNLTVNPNDLVEMKSFLAIERIRDILEKEGLTDQERTMQIRYIIYTLEAEGVSIQNRVKRKRGGAPFSFFDITLLLPNPKHGSQPCASRAAALPLLFLHLRQIPFLRLPGGADFVQIPPYAHRKPC